MDFDSPVTFARWYNEEAPNQCTTTKAEDNAEQALTFAARSTDDQRNAWRALTAHSIAASGRSFGFGGFTRYRIGTEGVGGCKRTWW